MDIAESAAIVAGRVWDGVSRTFSSVFIDPGSTFSAASLLSALVISAAFLMLRRKRRTPLSFKALMRALLPKWLLRHPSSRIDAMLFIMNTMVTGVLIGWALISASVISDGVGSAVEAAFGSVPPGLPDWASGAVITMALFLAYDFGYWLDHYLKHKVPALWAFHSVHHTAEVLTPLTAYRMHPVDNLIFYNILAVTVGAVHGVTMWALGDVGAELTVSGANVVLVVFIFTLIHLQHSHIKIAFGGRLGRILFSPAHHHIHHSDQPVHYGKNLGSCLAIWDWMFATLHLPSARDRLTYGADVGADHPHSLTAALLHPFGMATREFLPDARRTAQSAKQ